MECYQVKMHQNIPIEIITHNFLARAHSHMQADSMYSSKISISVILCQRFENNYDISKIQDILQQMTSLT